MPAEANRPLFTELFCTEEEWRHVRTTLSLKLANLISKFGTIQKYKGCVGLYPVIYINNRCELGLEWS